MVGIRAYLVLGSRVWKKKTMPRATMDGGLLCNDSIVFSLSHAKFAVHFPLPLPAMLTFPGARDFEMHFVPYQTLGKFITAPANPSS